MPDRASGWTFLTNYALVMFCLERETDIRLREVAEVIGITERAVQRIVTELEVAGFITRKRKGRRNSYRVHVERPLRHPIENHRSVRDLFDLISHR